VGGQSVQERALLVAAPSSSVIGRSTAVGRYDALLQSVDMPLPQSVGVSIYCSR